MFRLFFAPVLAVVSSNAGAHADFRAQEYVERLADTSNLLNTVDNMYGPDDLSQVPIFKGGFINFGFWESTTAGSISEENRVHSSIRLYEKVLQELAITTDDAVLEIGSGLGLGCVLARRAYSPKSIVCLDASIAQTRRALSLMHDLPDASFVTANAHSMPFDSGTMDKIYSVEVVQHFEDLELFAKEAFRVLSDKGRAVLTTFFATREDSLLELEELIPTMKERIDRIEAIEGAKAIFESVGFHVSYRSIGANVWQGFDDWIAQTELRDTWNRNWLKAYQRGFIDYYVLVLEKLDCDVANGRRL